MLSTSMTTFLLIHKEVNSCTELYLELQLPLVAHGRNVGGTKLFDKVASVYGVKTLKTGDWIPQILSNFHVYNLYNAQWAALLNLTHKRPDICHLGPKIWNHLYIYISCMILEPGQNQPMQISTILRIIRKMNCSSFSLICPYFSLFFIICQYCSLFFIIFDAHVLFTMFH